MIYSSQCIYPKNKKEIKNTKSFIRKKKQKKTSCFVNDKVSGGHKETDNIDVSMSNFFVLGPFDGSLIPSRQFFLFSCLGIFKELN